ncbi:methyltransferase domain-containing protein [Pseudonocardia sp. NPDC049154]|uniref:class I SAM-dependent methyltransferase n=1 Tax=Pseudonocardia sp. NPDC049154 TaxID=3155501 RepID=UPI0033CBDDB4
MTATDTTTTTDTTDTAGTTDAAESLTERLFAAVLATMDVHAVYLGDRLGYYRALADGPDGTALTPAELAARTGTAERYTREWCEQQAVTGILTADAEPDGTTRRYSLPAAHRAALVDVLSLDHVVPLARFALGCAKQTDLLAEAFRTGGGVSWAQHGTDASEGQAAASRPLFLGPLGREYLPSVPDLDATLRAGARVADVGCGHGWSAIGIALAYPEVTVDGFDLDEPSVEAARRNAREAGVADRVRFHLADAGSAGGTYDVVFAFECIHDLPDPVAVLEAMHGLGGTVVVMDERVAESFTAPGDEIERLMYGYSLLCCLADGMAHEDSAGTGTVMRPDTLRGYAREAGFADVEILDIENDFFRFYRLVR